MHVLITGGTGLIGRALVAELHATGHSATVVTRHPVRARQVLPAGVTCVNGRDRDELARAVGDADGIVNLAGENLSAGRWTARRKQAIRESRLAATRGLVTAMRRASRVPSVLVSASAVGYYGADDERVFVESDAPAGDFLASVCKAWEDEARAAEGLGVRLVTVRFGVVLAREGGALPRMMLPFRLYAGGPIGHGRQWLPWIHRADAVGIILHALTNESVRGALNATAPEAHTNASFSRALGQAMRRPCWLPVPALALRLALGEMSQLLLTGQRVEPRATQQSGYAFRFPRLAEALAQLTGFG